MSDDGVLAARPAVPGEEVSRVALTAAAVALLQRLTAQHGPLMFHQSGGCCDGSSPMCFTAGTFRTGAADVLLGVFDLPGAGGTGPTEVELWMSREQFARWRHTHLTLDVVEGRGAGFSLEAPLGRRFLLRSRLLEPGAGDPPGTGA